MVCAQSVHPLRFQKVTGLSQHTVFTIHQDQLGFLWVGTGDGLNRYDGNGFRVYKPAPGQQPHAIKGRVIRNRLVEDSAGKIWVSTENGIEYLNLDNSRFTYLTPFNDTGFYQNGSMYPILTKNNQVWFGKSAAGMLMYDIQTKKFQLFPYPCLQKNPLNFFGEHSVADTLGNIWTTQSNGLYCFNIHSKKWQYLFAGKKLAQLCLSGTLLYIVSEAGILAFDTQTLRCRLIEKMAMPFLIRTIIADKHQQVWMGDVAGNIFSINAKDQTILKRGNINTDERKIIPVYALYFDRSDNLWIGTDGMGLLKANIHSPDFSVFPDPSLAATDPVFIRSIFEAEDGLIWLGTFGKGILLLNKNNGVANPLDMRDFNNRHHPVSMVSFIKADEHQNIWVGYNDQLYCRIKGSGSFSEVSLPFQGNRDRLQITGMHPYQNHWMITSTLGSFELFAHATHGKHVLMPDNKLGDFSFLLEVKENYFLAGYNEGGLINTTSVNGTWLTKRFLPIKMGFKCLLPEKLHGLYWFGTDNGLMAYDPTSEKYKLYTEEDGLGNGFIYGILEADGNLWVSTNGGLSLIQCSDTTQDGFPAIFCKNFTKTDGLQDNEFNSNAFLKGRDGSLYFGGINGVNWFIPSAIKPDRTIEQLAITEFTVNNLSADSNLSAEYIKDLHLTHDQNNLFLRFQALEFTNPEKIVYAYKLSGWEKDWVYARNNHEVRYNNLPPGNYVFTVKASYNNQDWMAHPRTIHIYISAPFWKTWWFLL